LTQNPAFKDEENKDLGEVDKGGEDGAI